MSNSALSKGRCYYCQAIISKNGMTRHLRACEKRKLKIKSSKNSMLLNQKIFHIVIDDAYLKEYWLHIEVSGKLMLYELDQFIRDIWVECCDHLSAFEIDNTRYFSTYDKSMSVFRFFSDIKDRDMDIELGEILKKGKKFKYKYDFGSTTELDLKVVDERVGKFNRRNIEIMARNLPPQFKCSICGKKAKYIYTITYKFLL